MNTILTMRVAAGAAALMLGGAAIAQNTEEVQVQATRAMTSTVVGRSTYGVPIVDVSLSYGVSIEGLDLTSSAGAAELEKRVNQTAQKACKELGRKYPTAKPSDAECAKAAADKAMLKVHELVAAAKGPVNR